MCGFAGATDQDARPWAMATSDALAHRGPDGAGIWPETDVVLTADGAAPADIDGPVFVHRRLATTDLTARAAQPMTSRDGRFVLVFNGYIGGYRQLSARMSRGDVNGPNPARVARGPGQNLADTDVLLRLLIKTIRAAGGDYAAQVAALGAVLADMAGAFSFALWDCHTATLWMAVDEMGQKPLFFTHRDDGHLFFASELSPLLTVPGVTAALHETAFDAALAHLFVPAPKTVFGHVLQLQPGEIARWKNGKLECYDKSSRRSQPLAGGSARSARQNQRKLFTRSDVLNPDVEHIKAARMKGAGSSMPTAGQVVSDMRRRVYRAVAEAMTCDRPVACLLSGGMDSAGIAAMASHMDRHRADKTKRPTAIVMGFRDQRLDETRRAQHLADHLGLTLQIVAAPHRADDILQRLQAGLLAFGGPFANPAMILTHRLSQAVAEIASVCLTGDGGDEIFGGYRRYRMAQLAQEWLAMPRLARRGLAACLTFGEPYLPTVLNRHFSGMYKFLQMTTGSRDDVLTGWNNRCVLARYGRLQNDMTGLEHDIAAAMMQFDQSVTLPGNQLAMSDRMGMAFGVEYRPPLLDPAVRKLARLIPVQDHLAGQGKAIWRAVVRPMVPARYLDGAKAGFNPPVGNWVRDVSMLIWGDENTAQKHIFSPVQLTRADQRKIWRRACANDFDAALTVWNLLVWQVWETGQKSENKQSDAR